MRKFLAITLMLLAQSAWAGDTVWGGDSLEATLVTAHGKIPMRLEYSLTPDAREYGLMYRTSLATMDGMLFVFPKPQPIAFWMKNTKIPLDMLFLDTHGVIRHIAHDAVPESLAPIPSGGPVLSVVEIAGGRAEKDGIHEGDRVDYTLPKDEHVE